MKIRFAWIYLGLACILFGFTGPGKKYIKKIEKHRKKVHKEFLEDAHSPLKGNQKEDFEGLDYFPPNEVYKVVAKVVRTDDAKPFMIPTSNPERPKQFVKYAILQFELGGQELELSVYRNMRLSEMKKYKDHLFLPFKDHTNGISTYGGGRYMDLTVPKKNKLVLDFNLSYNPYCAYSDGWACPVPPEENHLPVPVEAGVKKYDDHH